MLSPVQYTLCSDQTSHMQIWAESCRSNNYEKAQVANPVSLTVWHGTNAQKASRTIGGSAILDMSTPPGHLRRKNCG